MCYKHLFQVNMTVILGYTIFLALYPNIFLSKLILQNASQTVIDSMIPLIRFIGVPLFGCIVVFLYKSQSMSHDTQPMVGNILLFFWISLAAIMYLSFQVITQFRFVNVSLSIVMAVLTLIIPHAHGTKKQ